MGPMEVVVKGAGGKKIKQDFWGFDTTKFSKFTICGFNFI